jgi:hypothetical protein
MKLPAVLLSVLVLAAAAAAGCGKPSDLVPTVEETRGLAENAQHRLAELGRRGDDLARRLLSLKPDGLDPQPVLGLLGEARTRHQELMRATEAAKAQIAAAEKAGTPDDLAKFLTRLRAQVADGQLIINSNLDAIEAWLVRAENRPRLTAAATPPAAKEEPAPGTGGGSAAPAPTQAP